MIFNGRNNKAEILGGGLKPVTETLNFLRGRVVGLHYRKMDLPLEEKVPGSCSHYHCRRIDG